VNILQEMLGDQIGCLAPQGRLDAVTVPVLEAAIDDQFDAGHVRLVINLADVSYISSSGLRALLSARRRAQAERGDVVLCAMNDRVREVFEMIGFNNLFRIFRTPAEAAAGLAASVTG
jgi:anti-anti-sigma factor